MPEETKKEEKLVDIDTTGPGADVELPEEKEKAVKRLHDDYRRQSNSTDPDDEFIRIQTCNGSAES